MLNEEDLKEERVCEVKEAKTFFVSGAPVTVKSVEEDTAGKGIIALKIKVGNVGIGDITKQGEKFGTYDTLAYEIDDPSWECKSSGKVNEAKLTDGETNIVCKLKEALAEDVLATKQLGLTFRYTYRNLIQQPITIQQSIE